MRVMLTSCGLETEQIKEHFLQMLGKEPADTLKTLAGQIFFCMKNHCETVIY